MVCLALVANNEKSLCINPRQAPLLRILRSYGDGTEGPGEASGNTQVGEQ